MIFRDRMDAAIKLAHALAHYKNKPNTVVLGLPRGGVVLAAEIARQLNIPLDVICPRKIGAPYHKEYAIGAITETGEFITNNATIEELGISGVYLENEIEAERKQAQRRLVLFRQGKPARDLEDKCVILVDDGLATGLTMKAAIMGVRQAGAEKIIVAVPVAPAETVQRLQELVDEVYCLSTPMLFQAIGQFYQDFSQVEDDEVVELMKGQSARGPA